MYIGPTVKNNAPFSCLEASAFVSSISQKLGCWSVGEGMRLSEVHSGRQRKIRRALEGCADLAALGGGVAGEMIRVVVDQLQEALHAR